MRIYSMTATFGKLEHETLTLKPGLNILQAPNEWGKSTWCAFLLAMLYGLDTRAKTTKSALADKERFAPWSGAPMEGRMDLHWQGRDITIERRTTRRIPLGDFRAYETHSGLPVPELTAANCGQMLLGVEQTVFRRAGFIRFSDLPVTQDEALGRRLNALVTTGDESGASEHLARELKELKNRIRYNRTGLLPQAESRRGELERKLRELQQLQQQILELRQQLEEGKQWLQQLENHRAGLSYAASQLDAHRIAQARDARDRGLQQLTELEHTTSVLPSREIAQREAEKLQHLLAQWNDLQLEMQMLSQEPQAPREEPAFRGLTPDEAERQVRRDMDDYAACCSRKLPLLRLAGMLVSLAAGAALVFLEKPIFALIPAGVLLLCVIMAFVQNHHRQRRAHHYETLYGSRDPDLWLEAARNHGAALTAYHAARQADRQIRSGLEARLADMEKKRTELGRGETPEKALYLWNQAIRSWDAYYDALRDQAKLDRHLQDLQAMARSAPAPNRADPLDYSEEQTLVLLNDALSRQQQLQHRLGQYQGRMEALGDPQSLRQQLADVSRRISGLEDHYAALTLALETLAEARQQLQRRFAPRIARRAQQLLRDLTDGRYDRLTLGSDFHLQAAALAEDTLHDAWWRSDGTVDQLYLALRLAVAGELTPEAPLILDDALVRFDDQRLKSALQILQQESRQKQVLLFTCQGREAAMLPEEPTPLTVSP